VAWKKPKEFEGKKTVTTSRGLGKYMSREKYEEIADKLRFDAPSDPTLPLEERDPYHVVRSFINDFNQHRFADVVPGPVLVIDECMSSWTGVEDKYSAEGCPGKTYITRKPRPYGVEMKAVCDGESNICMRLEIQEGKERMRAKPYVRDYGVTTATTIRLNEPWRGTYRYSIMDAWFGSVKSCIALHALLQMFCICVVKTAHTMYPLKHLKDWGKTLSKRTDKGKIKLLKSKYQLKIPGEKLPENAPEYDMFAIGWMDKKVITCLFNVGTTAVVEDLKRMRSKRQLLEDGSGYETVKYFKVVPIVDVMARLFKYFPKVDIHDHYRQGSLSFHTHWPTKNW
jgi:hypothetical protein